MDGQYQCISTPLPGRHGFVTSNDGDDVCDGSVSSEGEKNAILNRHGFPRDSKQKTGSDIIPIPQRNFPEAMDFSGTPGSSPDSPVLPPFICSPRKERKGSKIKKESDRKDKGSKDKKEDKKKKHLHKGVSSPEFNKLKDQVKDQPVENKKESLNNHNVRGHRTRRSRSEDGLPFRRLIPTHEDSSSPHEHSSTGGENALVSPRKSNDSVSLMHFTKENSMDEIRQKITACKSPENVSEVKFEGISSLGDGDICTFLIKFKKLQKLAIVDCPQITGTSIPWGAFDGTVRSITLRNIPLNIDALDLLVKTCRKLAEIDINVKMSG